MNCQEFQSRINDFIFDKIEYSDEIETFLNHAKECPTCSEELSLYYSIRRGLGDLQAPDARTEGTDALQELESIKKYYDDLFRKRKLIRRIENSVGIFCGVVLFVLIAAYLLKTYM